MPIQVKQLPNSEAELEIALEREVIASIDEQVYQKLAETVEIAGFRKGKAPKTMVLEHIGHEKYNQEFVEHAVEKGYFDALVEHKLTPIAEPEIQVTKFVPGETLEFKAKISLMPRVELPDYKSIKIEKKLSAVADEEVEKVIKDLRTNIATYVTKKSDETAASGDRVEIDFDGTVDGKPLEKGSSKNHPVIIGDGGFVPGFEDNLIGLKAGEEKEFDIKFPEDYYETSLRGKVVRFKVKMNLIQKIELPELNDEFASRFGPYKSLTELKDKIRANLKEEKDMHEEMRIKNEIINTLIDRSKIEIPPKLVEKEQETILSELRATLEKQGVGMEQYLKSVNKTEDNMRDDAATEAIRRIKSSLLIGEVAKAENIDVNDDEIAQAAASQTTDAPDDNTRSDIKYRLIVEKTVDWLLQSATAK